MPLFRGPATWDQIKSLIAARAPEHELLDYKASLPQNVEKTIAAMANTYGGDIVVGVAEAKEADGRPQPLDELEGIAEPDVDRLKQSIEQRNFNIHPPVLNLSVEPVRIPATEHPRKTTDRFIVVARVQQSELTPHFVPGMGHYYRVGSHSKPYKDEHLSTERIEWLLDRRRRHVEFREELVSQIDWIQSGVAWHKVWCVPSFPSPGASLWEASGKEMASSVPTIKGKRGPQLFFCWDFDCLSIAPRSSQNGWLWQMDGEPSPPVSDRHKHFTAYYVDNRGSLCLKALTPTELVATTQVNDLNMYGARKLPGIRFDWSAIAIHLIGVARHATHLYSANGYMGPVRFGLELGLAADTPRLDLFLGKSPYLAASDSTSDWGVLEGLSSSPAMTFGRLVREEHDCRAAGELCEEVRAAALQSQWTSAFNCRLPLDHMPPGYMEGCLAKIGGCFIERSK
jgi:hypothetical protein